MRSRTVSIKSRPLANGTVRWSLYFRPALPDGTTLLHSDKWSSLDDRPKVEAWAATYRVALAKGQTKPSGETCDQVFARCIAYEKELGRTDTGKKATRWKKWVAPKLGHKAPRDVTREDIEAVRDALDAAIAAWEPGKAAKNGTCLSGKTAMNAWTALTSTFKAMTTSKRRDLRVLDGRPNPCVGVQPPGDRESRKARRKTFLYPKEASALVACERVPMEWREVYAVALYSYLRPGELRVLTVGDVSLDGWHFSVTKAWDYEDGKVKPPKTRNGVRRVPIEVALRPLIARLVKGRDASALLVPALAGFGEDHLAQLFREHLTWAGVSRTELHESTRTHVQGNFRSCRDSGITWLAMSGLEVAKIMRRAGHDDIQTTMGYVKLAEDLGGELGAPFAPLPETLLDDARHTAMTPVIETCEPRVNGEPPSAILPAIPLPSEIAIVPEEGVEPQKTPLFPEDCGRSCEPPTRSDTSRDGPTRGRSLDLREACALANAARELLRAGLTPEARGIVERLAAALGEAYAASVPRVIHLGDHRAKQA